MRIRAYPWAFSVIAVGLACGTVQARGFGGGGRGAGGAIFSLGAYGAYDNTADSSSLFSSGGFSPYGSQRSAANSMPTGPYGANQYGGTAGNPVGVYTGYPPGIGGGGGLRDFADIPVNSVYRSGTSYLQNGTSWSQGGSWNINKSASLPTDLGMSGPSTASPGSAAHSTMFMSRSAMANQARAVRGSFEHYNAFTPDWYKSNPRAWVVAAGAPFDAWATGTAQSLGEWCGTTGNPQYFDYGNNVVVADGRVFVNGADVGTAQQYAEQAIALAEQGRTATASGPWMPLGVYALAQATEGASNQVFELAIDKNGIIRGNFWEPLQNTNTIVYGKADKSSLRAAWSVGDSQKIVFETGLFNLTSVHTPVLVHFAADKTRQWLLVRLDRKQGSLAEK